MSKTVDMTHGSATKHILSFAFPLLLTNLGQQLYMIVDAAIVGRGVGMNALAAVGATDWTYWLLFWTVIGLAQGFSTFISRCFGDKNFPAMNRVIAQSTVLCAVFGILFTVTGIAAALPILNLLQTPADILDSAHTYLVTMVSGILVVTAYNMASAILRALGDGKTPLIAMVIAAFLNIGLDCLFVFVFHWGIFLYYWKIQSPLKVHYRLCKFYINPPCFIAIYAFYIFYIVRIKTIGIFYHVDGIYHILCRKAA